MRRLIDECCDLRSRGQAGPSVAMAPAAVAGAADRLVAALQLRLSGFAGERGAEHCDAARHSRLGGARAVARAGAHRPHSAPTRKRLLGAGGPLCNVVVGDLEHGRQRRLPARPFPATLADSDISAAHHLHAAAAGVEAGRPASRCDAGRLADRASGLPGVRRRVSRRRGRAARYRACSPCRPASAT